MSAKLEALTRAPRSGDPLGARLRERARAVLGSPRDLRETAEAIASVQRPVSTGRRLAVVGVRGGAGTTAVAGLLALTAAAYRGDPTLAVDTDAELAALCRRLGLAPGEGTRAIVGGLAASQPTALAEVDAVLPLTATGLRVLPPGAPGTPGARVQQLALAGSLSRFFGVSVLDMGPEASGSQGASAGLRMAHAVVLVAPASVDGLRALDLAVNTAVAAEGQDCTRRLSAVLVSQHPGNEGIDIDGAVLAARVPGMAVFHVAFDRHLAAAGPLDGLDSKALASATQRTAVRLASRVLHRARQAGSAVPDVGL